jgi:ATP-dependent helicase/nuclease subunit B
MTQRRDPAVFTIAPGRAFLDALAAGILHRHGHDPLLLSGVTVLLPTRRACRALTEAFLRQSDGKALLLPVIRPLGDIDEDELDLRGAGSGDEALPFSSLDRNLLLAKLVRHSPLAGDDPAAALRLARELSHLLDAAVTEEVGLDRLPDLVKGDLSLHWQQTLTFLDVIRTQWPAIKAEQGRMDAAEYRQRMTQRWIEHWQEHPPAGPVLAAGSTGTIPATARLLGLVARLPQGCVVLPGLDRQLDDAAWSAARTEPTHPQHALARLLDTLGLPRDAVQDWQHAAGDATAAARAMLLSAALLPPGETHRWRGMGAGVSDLALQGLQRIEAAGQREEALAIALAMRETLEQPGRTAALVTPDRMLARRVAVELTRYGITVNDSAGQPLDQTPPAVFLRLLASAVAAHCAAVPLLALLKHPFCRLSQTRLAHLAWIRRVERVALRRSRAEDGLMAIAAELQRRDADLLPPLARLATILQPLLDLQQRDEVALDDMLRQQIVAAEALVACEDPDPPSLWQHDSGEALHGVVVELLQAAAQLGSLPPAGWPRLLDALLEGQVVRPRQSAHPRLFIWGLLEARLQHADRIILGGLNEGTWPPQAKDDPWLSRPMREGLGLSPPEFRLGQTAHDFMQAACGADVILSRAAKVDGTPTVPARWLLRLDALLDGDPRWPATRAAQYLAWAEALDRPAGKIAAVWPEPRPPVAARPRTLFVTDIETWIRDPYALYARRILKLRSLDPPDQAPDARLRGDIIHGVLDRFLKAHPADLPADDAALEELRMLGRDRFGAWLQRPEIAALWWPRFERAMHWFVAYERSRRADGFLPVALEQGGALEISAPAGTFTVQARADRIDRHRGDGRLAILDYKTGRPPSAKQVHSGLSPQLALEAAIAAGGGFAGLAPAEIAELVYIRLSGGGEEPGEATRIEGSSRAPIPPADDLARDALTRLTAWVARFDDPAMPYLSRPRPQFVTYASDYDHLARVAERADGGGDDA